MKRICCFLMFGLILCHIISAQTSTTKIITLTYSADDFEVKTEDSLSYITSSVHELMFESDTLTPAIPFISVNVLIQPNCQYDSFSFDKKESLIQSQILLAANVEVLPTDTVVAATHYTKSKVPSYPLSTYPLQMIKYVGNHFMDGYKFLSFHIYPLRYDALNKNLFLSTSISFKINLKRIETDLSCIPSTENNMRNCLNDIIVNPEDIDSLYTTDDNLRSINEYSEDDYRYLIITNNSLKPAFQNLANWKTTKGVRAQIITTEDIYANSQYNGSTNPIRIKKAIKDYYTNRGTKFVLLGGDTNIIPAQLCYIKFVQNGNTHTDMTPCDWYYACPNTIDWDSNGNGKAGEIEDNVSIAPSLFVSRLSVVTTQQAEAIISKIINYEQNPFEHNWNNNILLAGDSIYERRYMNGSLMSDAHYKGMKMFEEYIEPYWSGSYDRFYDTETDFSGGANYELNPTNFQTVLSNGYSIINMDSHSNYYNWLMEDESTYGTYLAGQLHSPRNSIIVTTGCRTNGFDQTTALSEVFMRNPDSGILAYWGSSRKSLNSLNFYQLGYNFGINGHFYESLLSNGGKCIGEAATNAKSNYLSDCNTYSSPARWTLLSYNLLGDPEMCFYSNMPQTFNNITASFVNGQISINTNVSGSMICIMSTEDYGESYYHVVANCNNLTISPTCNECTICVSKPGYIPYPMTLINKTYLQNQTFTASQTVNSGETYIGKDVISSLPQGAVVVQNGTLTINSSKETYIKNCFEVNTGAQLIINKTN